MDMSQLGAVENAILLGIVNEKLRLECDNLDELVSVYELDRQQVIDKLDGLGFHYDPLTNQFKRI